MRVLRAGLRASPRAASSARPPSAHSPRPRTVARFARPGPSASLPGLAAGPAWQRNRMDKSAKSGYIKIAEHGIKPILTETRKDKLADYALNISVASFAVAAFGGNWFGVIPALAGLALFFILTRED